MKVFVAGATGVAGRPAVRKLVEAGHDVSGVARGPEKARLVESLGARPIKADIFDAASVKDAVGGHDAVVNLATHIPSGARYAMPSAWKENDRIRREASRNLVDAALAAGCGRYVQESIAFMYRDGGLEWIDEDVPLDVPPLGRSTPVAEGNARRFTESGGTGIVLRFGQFFAPDAAHTRDTVRIARRGISPFLGPRDAYTPVIHASDIGSAVVAALRAPAGVYNAVDDQPLTRAELSNVLAQAVGRKRLRAVPAPVLRLAGKNASLLLRSQRASNRRFKQATGWTPEFPSARETIPAVVRGTPA